MTVKLSTIPFNALPKFINQEKELEEDRIVEHVGLEMIWIIQLCRNSFQCNRRVENFF